MSLCDDPPCGLPGSERRRGVPVRHKKIVSVQDRRLDQGMSGGQFGNGLEPALQIRRRDGATCSAGWRRTAGGISASVQIHEGRRMVAFNSRACSTFIAQRLSRVRLQNSGARIDGPAEIGCSLFSSGGRPRRRAGGADSGRAERTQKRFHDSARLAHCRPSTTSTTSNPQLAKIVAIKPPKKMFVLDLWKPALLVYHPWLSPDRNPCPNTGSSGKAAILPPGVALVRRHTHACIKRPGREERGPDAEEGAYARDGDVIDAVHKTEELLSRTCFVTFEKGLPQKTPTREKARN